MIHTERDRKLDAEYLPGAEAVRYNRLALERLQWAAECLASANKWIESATDYMDDIAPPGEATAECALQYIGDAAAAVRVVMKRVEERR